MDSVRAERHWQIEPDLDDEHTRVPHIRRHRRARTAPWQGRRVLVPPPDRTELGGAVARVSAVRRPA